ncbi:MAG TPA: DUF1349 domain-containing protein [Verrucomicrobiae bacterium]|nr:DUF1349 domain-containing protein [Verrucomicrobiae bacterium]
MKIFAIIFLTVTLSAKWAAADEIIFQDEFKGHLGNGWSWVREHRDAWRVSGPAPGLEVLIEPGNMWGPANNAHNLLVRAAPDASSNEIQISVTFETHPTNQYEQADLTWYFDDSNMVKIGRELVDGKVSVVMGREEKDKTRTIAIIPIKTDTVRLQLEVKGNHIRGRYLSPDGTKWLQAGECDLPPSNLKPRISLQFYQGPANSTHWARVTGFRVIRLGN